MMLKSIKKFTSCAALMSLLLAGSAFAQDDGHTAPAVAAEPTTPTATGDVAPLDIKLPKPTYTGTPKPVSAPNLEQFTGRARPPFMAPKGARNLAAGKSVTSSDNAPIVGDLAQVTDGDKEGVDGSFLELGPGKQWVQIDLGEKAELYAVVLWHFHSESRAYFDVIVQVSDDPDFTTGITTLFNNDHDNSSGMGIGKDKAYIDVHEGRLIDAKKAQGRYVRSYSNGNTTNELNNFIEIEVYGKPLSEVK